MRFHYLDYMKFFVAITVVMVHTYPDRESVLAFVMTNGIARICVPFLFMCTGFFLMKKAHKTG